MNVLYLIEFQNVTESVFYLTLNHSTPEVVQLLHQRVVQRCERGNEELSFKCTPHYDTQPNASELNVDICIVDIVIYLGFEILT